MHQLLLGFRGHHRVQATQSPSAIATNFRLAIHLQRQQQLTAHGVELLGLSQSGISQRARGPKAHRRVIEAQGIEQIRNHLGFGVVTQGPSQGLAHKAIAIEAEQLLKLG